MTKILKTAGFYFLSFFVSAVSANAAGDHRRPAISRGAPQENAKTAKKSGTPSAVSVKTRETGDVYTGFDEFNNLNDPLYREGSKALLEKANAEDKAARSAPAKPDPMRDAPADLPAIGKQAGGSAPGGKTISPSKNTHNDTGRIPALRARKSKLIKIVPADPVTLKSTL